MAFNKNATSNVESCNPSKSMEDTKDKNRAGTVRTCWGHSVIIHLVYNTYYIDYRGMIH